MSILQALAGHYERLVANGKAPDYGYSREPVSFAIVLSPGGDAVDVTDLRDASGRTPRPCLRHHVPRPVTRSSNVVSNFLWDKTAYTLGVKIERDTKQATHADREHATFKKLHEELLRATGDEGLKALRTFLQQWRSENYASLPHADDMLDANIIFRLDGEQRFLHQRPAARRIWQCYLTGTDKPPGRCLVSGEMAPIERLHPKIKGVRGAQSSGASVVSFNLDAFASFGKRQGSNAPVSKRAAFAYTTCLNTLLARDSARRIQIGDATTVFWAEAPGNEARATVAEDLFSMITEPPTDAEEAVKVGDKLSAIAEGKPLSDVEPKLDENTRFCVLGLAPNAARLSVRFWHVDRIGVIARRVGEHWRDLLLDPLPWTTPPGAWRLLYETAVQRKSANIPPILGGALMRSILTGGRYPRSLLAAVVARMRAEGDITALRAAICKACLARDRRLGFEMEDVPVSLNPKETNQAYRLGRLFAMYEDVQRTALGNNVNTTIKDRYLGAASATPASVFPLLERNSANHLATLRKGGKAGLAYWFEQQIDSIFDGLEGAFPRSLRLEDQGRFAIGYHHQRVKKRGPSDEVTEAADAETHDEE